MLAELLSHMFGLVIMSISSILVIWAFVDCVTSKRQGNKSDWILVIIFTQFIGAALYFISGQSHTLPRIYQFLKKWLWETDVSTAYYQPTQSPTSNTPEQQPYRDYQEGYQVQEYESAPYTPPSAQEKQTAQQSSLYPDYEQPQAMYPEMPQ